MRGLHWRRVTLIKGWFHEVLTEALPVHYNLTKASIIMIDSDLYSSAQQALAFCAPLIQDTAVLLFDGCSLEGCAETGWEQVVKGERQAFEEFMGQHPEFDVTPLESYAPWAASFLLRRRAAQRLAGPSGRAPDRGTEVRSTAWHGEQLTRRSLHHLFLRPKAQ